MKRSDALQPLSRDHHRALVAAKGLREAEDVREAGHSFLEFWRGGGRRHFVIEEEVLLPGWAADGTVDRDAVDRMLADHLEIRRQALRIERGDSSIDDLHELGHRLNDHVRFEERELFPAIEDDLDEKSLAGLAAAVEAAESEGGG